MNTLRSRLKNSARLPASIDARLPASIGHAIDRDTWLSMVASARLPTGEFDKEFAINLILTVLIPRLRHRMEAEDSRERTIAVVQRTLRAGRSLEFTIQTIEYAEDGEKNCHKALLLVGRELIDTPMEQRLGYTLIKGYLQRAGLRPHKSRSGRSWNDNLMRDFLICELVILVCNDFGLSATRDENARYIDWPLSGISLVAAALKRSGIRYHPGETRIQNGIWWCDKSKGRGSGLGGEMAREVYGWNNNTRL
jgi:hypothetical protein